MELDHSGFSLNVVDPEDRPGDHGVRSQWLQSVNVL